MSHYSQNDEQEFILRYFGERKGSLLDIGAFDGVTFSNTRALLEIGWSGILAEPDPLNFYKLFQNSKPFVNRVSLLPVAVASRAVGFAKLQMDTTDGRGWASTISERCARGVLVRSEMCVMVPIVSVADLGAGFDFINIDAEGMDFEILKAMPPQMLQDCKLICVEPHNPVEREEMREFLAQHSFSTAHETPENLIAMKICKC